MTLINEGQKKINGKINVWSEIEVEVVFVVECSRR